MAKYPVEFDDELENEVFDSEKAAKEYAFYLVSCSEEGAEILKLPNPEAYYSNIPKVIG